MKKIFGILIALSALISCSTEPIEEITLPTTLTAPMEVSVDSQSRAFDSTLTWSWSDGDTIAAYQDYGAKTVNTLTLNENKKFYCEQFSYSTAEPASFKFVYPAAALSSDKTLGYVQNGEWTPTLVGTVDNATVGAISSVTMEHHSAAFEIRVWDEGRAARKTIKSATLTSETDFCNGTTATVAVANKDYVVFNLKGGDYSFTLTLTDTNDKSYTVSIPQKNFVNGKRTILNVEWKTPSVSFLAYSSYNESDGDVIKNDSLQGNTIYVDEIALNNTTTGTIKLYIDGSEKSTIYAGSSYVFDFNSFGSHKVQVKLFDENSVVWSSEEVEIHVTGIPYHADWRNSDPNCTMSNITDKGNYLRVKDASWFGSVLGCVRTPAFHIPNGKMQVYTAIAATTGATSAGNYDKSYYYAGTTTTGATESGSYVVIPYVAADALDLAAALVAGTDAIELTTAKPCLIHTAKDFSPFTSTNIYQVKVTYNKQ